MDKGILKYEGSEIHFLRFGKGNRLLIALHGFADEASLFLKLEESLKETYTVYCIDLPFHGLTQWNKKVFDRKDISAIFKMILTKENKERFDLMGFSLGGRIVLKMLFEWIPQVDKFYLIAPDGLDTKWLSKVNLIPGWMKSFLQWILSNPGWVIIMVKRFYHWRLINRFTHNFVCYHIHTKENRNRLFGSWHSLGYFDIKPRKVKSLLKKYSVTIDMYFGTHDEVIPVSAAALLSTDMPNVRVFEIEGGHLLVNKKLNDLLKIQLH
jgi:pimeloyl-ACP methyl ester carboxylesterase